MRIEIRRNMRTAVIISFRTRKDEFESDYERSKFFRELYGWKQTVPKEEKKYFYRRNGIMDEIPHIKVADSVFIIAMKNMQRMMKFFDEWNEKVDYEIMEIMMRKNKLKEII
jgi:hypothetical protein